MTKNLRDREFGRRRRGYGGHASLRLLPANELRAAVLLDVGMSCSRLIALSNQQGHDVPLVELTKGCGQLAVALLNRHSINDILVQIAGFAAGWAEQLVGGPAHGDVFQRIYAERARQEGLLLTGKILFTCASRVADPKRKLRVLVEEVGEVAQAIDRLEFVGGDINARDEALKKAADHLTTELIQVAAVAVAWLESLEVKS